MIVCSAIRQGDKVSLRLKWSVVHLFYDLEHTGRRCLEYGLYIEIVYVGTCSLDANPCKKTLEFSFMLEVLWPIRSCLVAAEYVGHCIFEW